MIHAFINGGKLGISKIDDGTMDDSVQSVSDNDESEDTSGNPQVNQSNPVLQKTILTESEQWSSEEEDIMIGSPVEYDGTAAMNPMLSRKADRLRHYLTNLQNAIDKILASTGLAEDEFPPAEDLTNRLQDEYRKMTGTLNQLESIMLGGAPSSPGQPITIVTQDLGQTVGGQVDEEIGQLHSVVNDRDDVIRRLSERVQMLCRTNDQLFVDFENQEQILSNELRTLREQLEAANSVIRHFDQRDNLENINGINSGMAVMREAQEQINQLRANLMTRESQLKELEQHIAERAAIVSIDMPSLRQMLQDNVGDLDCLKSTNINTLETEEDVCMLLRRLHDENFQLQKLANKSQDAVSELRESLKFETSSTGQFLTKFTQMTRAFMQKLRFRIDERRGSRLNKVWNELASLDPANTSSENISEMEKASLTFCKELYEYLENELQSQGRKIDQLENEKEKSQAEFSNMKTRLSQHEAWNRDSDERIRQMERDRDEEMEFAKREHTDVMERLQGQKDQVTRLKQEIETLHTEKARLSREKQNTKDQCDRYERRISDLELKNGKLEKELSLESEKESERSEASKQLKSELNKWQQMVEDLTAQVTKHENSLLKSEEAYKKLRTELANAVTEKDTIFNRLRTTEVQLGKMGELEGQLQKQEHNEASLRGEIKLLQQDMDDSRRRSSQKIQEMEQELFKLRMVVGDISLVDDVFDMKKELYRVEGILKQTMMRTDKLTGMGPEKLDKMLEYLDKGPSDAGSESNACQEILSDLVEKAKKLEFGDNVRNEMVTKVYMDEILADEIKAVFADLCDLLSQKDRKIQGMKKEIELHQRGVTDHESVVARDIVINTLCSAAKHLASDGKECFLGPAQPSQPGSVEGSEDRVVDFQGELRLHAETQVATIRQLRMVLSNKDHLIDEQNNQLRNLADSLFKERQHMSDLIDELQSRADEVRVMENEISKLRVEEDDHLQQLKNMEESLLSKEKQVIQEHQLVGQMESKLSDHIGQLEETTDVQDFQIAQLKKLIVTLQEEIMRLKENLSQSELRFAEMIKTLNLKGPSPVKLKESRIKISYDDSSTASAASAASEVLQAELCGQIEEIERDLEEDEDLSETSSDSDIDEYDKEVVKLCKTVEYKTRRSSVVVAHLMSANPPNTTTSSDDSSNSDQIIVKSPDDSVEPYDFGGVPDPFIDNEYDAEQSSDKSSSSPERDSKPDVSSAALHKKFILKASGYHKAQEENDTLDDNKDDYATETESDSEDSDEDERGDEHDSDDEAESDDEAIPSLSEETWMTMSTRPSTIITGDIGELKRRLLGRLSRSGGGSECSGVSGVSEVSAGSSSSSRTIPSTSVSHSSPSASQTSKQTSSEHFKSSPHSEDRSTGSSMNEGEEEDQEQVQVRVDKEHDEYLGEEITKSEEKKKEKSIEEKAEGYETIIVDTLCPVTDSLISRFSSNEEVDYYKTRGKSDSLLDKESIERVKRKAENEALMLMTIADARTTTTDTEVGMATTDAEVRTTTTDAEARARWLSHSPSLVKDSLYVSPPDWQRSLVDKIGEQAGQISQLLSEVTRLRQSVHTTDSIVGDVIKMRWKDLRKAWPVLEEALEVIQSCNISLADERNEFLLNTLPSLESARRQIYSLLRALDAEIIGGDSVFPSPSFVVRSIPIIVKSESGDNMLMDVLKGVHDFKELDSLQELSQSIDNRIIESEYNEDRQTLAAGKRLVTTLIETLLEIKDLTEKLRHASAENKGLRTELGDANIKLKKSQIPPTVQYIMDVLKDFERLKDLTLDQQKKQIQALLQKYEALRKKPRSSEESVEEALKLVQSRKEYFAMEEELQKIQEELSTSQNQIKTILDEKKSSSIKFRPLRKDQEMPSIIIAKHVANTLQDEGNLRGRPKEVQRAEVDRKVRKLEEELAKADENDKLGIEASIRILRTKSELLAMEEALNITRADLRGAQAQLSDAIEDRETLTSKIKDIYERLPSRNRQPSDIALIQEMTEKTASYDSQKSLATKQQHVNARMEHLMSRLPFDIRNEMFNLIEQRLSSTRRSLRDECQHLRQALEERTAPEESEKQIRKRSSGKLTSESQSGSTASRQGLIGMLDKLCSTWEDVEIQCCQELGHMSVRLSLIYDFLSKPVWAAHQRSHAIENSANGVLNSVLLVKQRVAPLEIEEAEPLLERVESLGAAKEAVMLLVKEKRALKSEVSALLKVNKKLQDECAESRKVLQNTTSALATTTKAMEDLEDRLVNEKKKSKILGQRVDLMNDAVQDVMDGVTAEEAFSNVLGSSTKTEVVKRDEVMHEKLEALTHQLAEVDNARTALQEENNTLKRQISSSGALEPDENHPLQFEFETKLSPDGNIKGTVSLNKNTEEEPVHIEFYMRLTDREVPQYPTGDNTFRAQSTTSICKSIGDRNASNVNDSRDCTSESISLCETAVLPIHITQKENCYSTFQMDDVNSSCWSPLPPNQQPLIAQVSNDKIMISDSTSGWTSCHVPDTNQNNSDFHCANQFSDTDTVNKDIQLCKNHSKCVFCQAYISKILPPTKIRLPDSNSEVAPISNDVSDYNTCSQKLTSVENKEDTISSMEPLPSTEDRLSSSSDIAAVNPSPMLNPEVPVETLKDQNCAIYKPYRYVDIPSTSHRHALRQRIRRNSPYHRPCPLTHRYPTVTLSSPPSRFVKNPIGREMKTDETSICVPLAHDIMSHSSDCHFDADIDSLLSCTVVKLDDTDNLDHHQSPSETSMTVHPNSEISLWESSSEKHSNFFKESIGPTPIPRRRRLKRCLLEDNADNRLTTSDFTSQRYKAEVRHSHAIETLQTVFPDPPVTKNFVNHHAQSPPTKLDSGRQRHNTKVPKSSRLNLRKPIFFRDILNNE